jgi:hypothetical protein
VPRSAYSASKHALNALSTNLRMEVRATHPDNRAIPAAQPVEEVARVLCNAMERPCVEVFTRPEYKRQVADSYAAEDVADVESRPPFRR